MPDEIEVNDLSFLTLLALQEADCFRRRDGTEAHYLDALLKRLDATLKLDDDRPLYGIPPSEVLMYATALRVATGKEHHGARDMAAGLRALMDSMKDMMVKNAAGAAHEIGPGALRPAMAFIRYLHDRLLEQKQHDAAKRATRTILSRRR